MDSKREEKKESEADQIRMVREDEFHDVAEWFVMDDTDGDDDWCVIEETNAHNVVRAVQTEERVPEESLELIILDSGSDASLLPCDHPEAGKVNSGNTGVVLEDAQGNQIKSAGIVTAVIDIEQGDCWTAPSISENFIVSEATNILLSMGRILKNGWRLEYDPRISAEEQTSGAQHYLTVSSMVLVSPDGKAKARIFYKRNSCCLLGRISVVGSDRAGLPGSTRGTGSAPRQGNSRSSTDSWTAVERSVSVKVPQEFTELLDSTPNGKWTIMDDGTPFIVYQGTTFIDPQGGFPGWKWRTTMLGEGGSEWSVVELYSDYAANRSHNVQIPECYGATKRICTILHATCGNFFTFCTTFKMDLIGRVPSTKTPFQEQERGVPEELRTPVVPVKVAPGRSEGVLGPTYHGDGNPLSELEMQKSALKLKNEGKEKVRVEAQPAEPTEQERLEHEATHIPFAHWCESCVEAKSKQDHEKKNPEAGKDSVGVPYPIVQLDFMFLQGKDTPALVAICSWTRMSVVIPMSGKQTERKTVEKVLKWVHSIGHLDEVGFVGDSEEAMVSLVAAIVETRRKMNRMTHDQNNKPYQKGRTARVERFIQTVRNQTVCLVRAAPFGEYVFALKKPEKKGTANWIGGIYLGKNAQDLHLVGVEDGILATGSVRRIGTGWRKEPVLKLSVTPWNPKKPKGTFVKQPLPAPALASISEEAEVQEPVVRQGDLGQSQGEQLEEVLDMLATDLSVSGSGRASSRTSSRSGGMSGQEELVPDDMSLDEFKKRTLEHAELEAEESASKKVREGESSEPVSPSRGLYPPLFAGRVSQEDDIFHWDEHEDLTAIEGEDVEYEDLVEEEMEDEPKNDQGESPPEVSPEKLDSMDQEAAVEELNRLSKIGVIEEFAESGASGSEKRMDLREVYDWRYRDGKWRRRCRIVAREYRAGAASTADTFSPTASNAAARLVLLLHLLNPTWVILVLDIKDAYLQVPQQEEVLVTISDWMKRAANIGEGIVWRLKRCLPGQRNAATRWYEHLRSILERLGFEFSQHVPALAKHKTKAVWISIHVDDELLAGRREDSLWLVEELEKVFRVEKEGPYPLNRVGNGEELRYLKRKYVFVEEGIVVQPNEKYIKKLLELYDLGRLKSKATPEHVDLVKEDKSKELGPEETKRFRSGLGSVLYLAQDRIDIQYASKCLASSMSKPTQQALKCLKHLILYLSGTANRSTLLPYSTKGKRLITKLNGQEDNDEIPPGESHVVEAYSDSDWGSLKTPEKARRKSTSSGIIVLNGIQVLSFSRTQKATASSSCEAELYALSGTCSEAILIGHLFEFLTGENVRIEIRCDSSSARQWSQRRGIGRLKHVDVRLCQLQDWVRENTICIGTVKTVLNVADLNTKKLTYARRAFLMYFLSQVEYTEGEDIVYTGVDEYERYEQEKKLKEYVSSGQVKDLIRLIQVFSVIKPVTAAVWIKEEDLQSQYSGSVEAMEEVKCSRSEVMMLMTLLVLAIPYIVMAVRKVYSEWTRINMIGKVRINSSSKNYIFHRPSCRYVQGHARHGHWIHLTYDEAVSQGYRPCYKCFPESKKAQNEDDDDEWELTSEAASTSTETTESEGCGKKCTWCKVHKCTRRKPDHVYCSCTLCIQKYTEDLWRGHYDKEASSSSGPTGNKGTGKFEYMPPSVNQKGSRPATAGEGKGRRRGRAAMEPVREEQEGPMLPEASFTREVEEQPPTEEPTYEDMIVDPGTPDSTEERTLGDPDLYL